VFSHERGEERGEEGEEEKEVVELKLTPLLNPHFFFVDK